jgi:hypothetical protein
MRHNSTAFKRWVLSMACLGATTFQFGGCALGEITTSTTTTINTRELLIGLVRDAVLTPIDVYVTDLINGAFDAATTN